MKKFDRKAYNKEHYIKNKKLYQFRQRAKLGTLKNFDFDEIFDYFLHYNRPRQEAYLIKKFKKKST
jgi:hypothetical protein